MRQLLGGVRLQATPDERDGLARIGEERLEAGHHRAQEDHHGHYRHHRSLAHPYMATMRAWQMAGDYLVKALRERMPLQLC